MIISRRAEIGLLAIIMAVAALLRFLWLDTIPAGWHHDEALMGIMASQVYTGVQRPIFFTGYLGQEPLYIYLSAITMWLMGGNVDILPLRITSAVVGIATVVVTYLLGRELFGRRVGLIGAALFGLSFWQVMLDRDGYRLITQPLLQGLAIYLLWRASRLNSIWYYMAGGAAFGGVIYTYLGARAFPGVLVLFALWWVAVHGLPSGQTRSRVAVSLAVAFVVAAPLLLFFATHPGTFSARMSQISVIQPGAPEQNLAEGLEQNIIKLLASFTVYGEPLWRYNISGRPIFVGPVAFLFYVGLIVTVMNIFKKHAASAMAIAWFVVMLFPSFLSYDVGAYTFRSMGLVPMLYLVPAVGAVALWDSIDARVPESWRHRTQQAILASIIVILIAEGVTTYRDYFVVWANSFGSAYEDMVDVVAAARFLDREAKPGSEDIFISSAYYPHPVIAHLAPKAYEAARWFDGNSTIVLSTKSTRNSLYVFPFSALPKQLDSYLPSEAMVERSFFDNGTIKLLAYRLTPTQVENAVNKLLDDPAFTKANKVLGDDIELLSYRLDHRVEQGDKLSITAIWRTLKDAPPEDYVIFSHLLDNEGKMWAQYDTPGYPAAQWRAGDIVIGQYEMEIGNRVAPGKYAVDLGVYDRATLKRLAVKGATAPEDSVHLDFVKVASREQENVTPTTAMSKKLGEAIELQGFDLQRQEQTPGPPMLRLKLYWRADGVPKEDYTVFVQLLNSEGHLVAQSDGQPEGGRFPTSYWEPGEKIIDEHDLKLDKSLAPGRYKIITGMYLLSNGKRLTVEGGGDYITLTDIDIQP